MVLHKSIASVLRLCSTAAKEKAQHDEKWEVESVVVHGDWECTTYVPLHVLQFSYKVKDTKLRICLLMTGVFLVERCKKQIFLSVHHFTESFIVPMAKTYCSNRKTAFPVIPWCLLSSVLCISQRGCCYWCILQAGHI